MFTPVNATPLPGALFGDPCLIPMSDEEQVRFTDENGHANLQWFERVASTGNPNTLTELYFGPSPSPTPVGATTVPPLATTAMNPQTVDQSATTTLSSFSVNVLSTISSGPFKAQAVYWTAPTSASCLAITPASSTNGVFTFTLSTPPPTSQGGGTTSPCLSVGMDEEEVLFSDTFGNSNVQFFKL
jgi:hypothetical protein